MHNRGKAHPHTFAADSGLTGRLPEEVHFLPDLKRVDLSFNAISGSVPTQWGGLTKLGETYYLNISNLLIVSIKINPLQRNLEYLDLRSNDIDGSFPWQLCNNQETNGQIFNVDCSKVTCSCCVDCRT